MLIALVVCGVVAFSVLARRVARGVADLRSLDERAQRAVTALITLGSLAPVARVIGGRVLARGLGPLAPAFDALVTLGSVLALATVIAGMLLFGVDGARHAVRRLDRPVQPGTMGRRELLERAASATALLAGGGTAVWSATRARWDIQLEEVPIRLVRLPPALDGLCIAQLSDVHAGLALRERDLEEAVRLLRRARPDLIVLTGDLVDHDPAYLPAVGRLARRAVDIQPRFGVFAVLGNHDYYAGADRVVEVLRRAGVETLRNDGVRIVDGRRGLGLAGIDDVSAPRYAPGHAPDLARALAPLDPEETRVLLCHDPVQFDATAESIDLQLSGHTHGGQLVGGVPAEILFPHGYIAGRYVRGAAQIYVNRGIGTAGPPLRGSPSPEVTRIVLTAS